MDTSKLVFISKYIVNDKPAYAKIHWIPTETNLCNIKILNSGVCWAGHLSADNAENLRNLVLEDEEVFNNTVKEALEGRSGQFIYKIFVNDDKTYFSWSKTGGAVTFQHGSIELERVMDEDTNTFLDFLINENQVLKEDVEQFRIKEQSMKNELELCKSELKNIVNESNERDTSMYDKFVQLLNSKKRRIQVLESTVRQIEADYNIN